MSLKLSQLDAKLRARIESQIAAEDAAKRGAVCPVSPAVAQPGGRRPAPRPDAPQEGRARGVVVSLIGLRRRPLDDDNFVGACKHLRDAIAASLGIDDGDKRIRFQYGQFPTQGREGVLVHIEVI